MSERSDKDIESFIGAMHVIGRDLAEKISRELELNSFRRLLDVGGGSGVYTIAFLKRAPALEATLFDLPRVIGIAERKLIREGFRDRVTLVNGDYTTDPLPAGHDLVLLSAIVHINSRQRNRALFKKIFDALEPRGMLLIRDYFLDDSRTRPVDGALFGVNMLVATEAGESHAFRDVAEDLVSEGFIEVRMLRDGNTMDQLVAAIKP